MPLSIKATKALLVQASNASPPDINTPDHAFDFIQQVLDRDARFVKESETQTDAWSIGFKSKGGKPLLLKAHPVKPWPTVEENLLRHRQLIQSLGYSQRIYHTWRNRLPQGDKNWLALMRFYLNDFVIGQPLTPGLMKKFTSKEQKAIVRDVLELQKAFAQIGFRTNTSSQPHNILLRDKPLPGQQRLVLTDWNAISRDNDALACVSQSAPTLLKKLNLPMDLLA